MKIKKHAGFTLIETLVTMALLSIAIIPLSGLAITYRKSITDMKIRSDAMAAAQQVAESYRFGDITSLQTSGTTSTSLAVSGRNYTIYTDFCTVSAYCTTSTRHLLFRVHFNAQQKYQMETVFTQLR